MRRWWRWLKPAGLFAISAGLARVRRDIERDDRRRRERRELAEAIDRRTEEAAEAELPQPTIWPVIAALGIAFGLWGIILHTFFFGIGLLLIVVSLAGWMNLVFHDKPPYHETTPTEDPFSR